MMAAKGGGALEGLLRVGFWAPPFPFPRNPTQLVSEPDLVTLLPFSWPGLSLGWTPGLGSSGGGGAGHPPAPPGSLSWV